MDTQVRFPTGTTGTVSRVYPQSPAKGENEKETSSNGKQGQQAQHDEVAPT